MRVTTASRPRAVAEPIDRHEIGLRTIVLSARLPPCDETIVLCLDDDRRAFATVVIAGTVEPDAVVDVVEYVTAPALHRGRLAGVVVGTIRTRRTDARAAEADIDRWMEISAIADDHGVDLVEWYVVEPDGACCPRDRLGEPPRW